ncbi:MAG: alpha/beta hydrolase [Phycisphaerales bacterium JB064]
MVIVEAEGFDTSLEVGVHAGQRVLMSGVPLAEARVAMVMLHGRGASPEDILSLASAYEVGQVCFVAPAAAGNSWYPGRFDEGDKYNGPYVDSAFSIIEGVLSHLAKHDLPPERCVLGGFSQGACLAVTHAAMYPRRYGLIVAYSGALIGKSSVPFQPHGSLEGTPVDISGGGADYMVPWRNIDQTARVLRAMDAEVFAEQYPEQPHTVSRAQVDATREHLERLIASAG